MWMLHCFSIKQLWQRVAIGRARNLAFYQGRCWCRVGDFNKTGAGDDWGYSMNKIIQNSPSSL